MSYLIQQKFFFHLSLVPYEDYFSFITNYEKKEVVLIYIGISSPHLIRKRFFMELLQRTAMVAGTGTYRSSII
jgi:hypothetical protein